MNNYLGTIVSNGDINIRGENISNINLSDRGTIIAHGDVSVEMKRASLDQVNIQAQNVTIRLIEDLVIRGIIAPTVLPDGPVIHMLDLRKFAKLLGIINDSAITKQILSHVDFEYSGAERMKQTNETPKDEQTQYGGSNQPVLLYKKSDLPDVPVVIQGEKQLVPVYDPQLLFNTCSKISNLIQAQKKATFESMKNIQVYPGKIDVQSRDFGLLAKRKVSLLSQYVYSSSGECIEVDKVALDYPGDVTISGDQGVAIRASDIHAGKNLAISSKHGDIIDSDMPLDLHITMFA